MTPVPGRHDVPELEGPTPGARFGRSLNETAQLVASALPDDDATPEAPPSAKAPETPTTAPLPVLPASPELAEVRRVYGEQGVSLVLAEVRQQHITAETEKLKNDPELGSIWRDPEARAEAVQEIRNWGTSQGYSEAELDGITDARTVKVAWAALQRGKALAAPPPSKAKPEAARHQAQEAATDAAATRFLTTHSMRDAARLIEHLI